MQKSVLIADDDQFIQDLLGFIVEDQGHRHLQCKTGWDVITLIEHEKIDLLILDVLLPQMSGIEVVKKLKQKNLMQRVPILLITGVYSPDQLKKSLGDDWTRLKTLYKPLSLSDFQKTLSQYLIPHNEVNYVFPHCVSHKPGFQKRIMLSDSRNFNNETDQSVKWFIPKNGSFSDFRFLHILLQLGMRGGKWALDFKTENRNGSFIVHDTAITHFISDHTDDLIKESPTDRFKKFTRDIFRSNHVKHPWMSGLSATPLKKMFYELTTELNGEYILSRVKEISDKYVECEPIPIFDMVEEGIEGEFPIDIIRNTLVLPKGRILICDHVLSSCKHLFQSESYEKLFNDLEEDNTIQNILKKDSDIRNKILSNLYSTWLIGGVEIISKSVQAPVEMKIKKKKVERKTIIPRKKKQKSIVKDESEALYSKIRKMYRFGLAGRYYDFLDLDIDDDYQKISQQIDRIGLWIRSTKLPDSAELKVKNRFQTLSMSIREAKEILLNSKFRRSYQKILREDRDEKKIKLAKYHFQVGLDCISEENHIKGIAEMRICLYLKPDDTRAFENILSSMRVFPEYFEMLFDLAKRAVRLDEFNTAFKVVLGYCYKELGKNQDAEKVFKKILDMDPDNVEAMHYLLDLPGYDKNLDFTVE